MDIDHLVAEYERDGVIKVPRLLSREKVNEIRKAIDAYTEKCLPSLPAGDVVLEADGKTVRNFWRMDEYDAYFADLVCDLGIEGLIHKLVYGEAVVMSVESFNKPARIGSAVPAHQDNAYFCLTPPNALTLWIAIDEVTEENGPVHYVRGSHLAGHQPHVASQVSGNSMGLESLPECADSYAGLLAAGDALIHHAETVHYSAPNTSERARLGLLVVYRGAHCIKDSTLVNAYERGR